MSFRFMQVHELLQIPLCAAFLTNGAKLKSNVIKLRKTELHGDVGFFFYIFKRVYLSMM